VNSSVPFTDLTVIEIWYPDEAAKIKALMQFDLDRRQFDVASDMDGARAYLMEANGYYKAEIFVIDADRPDPELRSIRNLDLSALGVKLTGTIEVSGNHALLGLEENRTLYVDLRTGEMKVLDFAGASVLPPDGEQVQLPEGTLVENPEESPRQDPGQTEPEEPAPGGTLPRRS